MPLVLTLGFGPSHLIPTSGYGLSLTTPAGNAFRLDSAELPADNTVRARFTRKPNSLTTGPYGIDAFRATYVPNWTLTGPNGVVAIQLATTASDDDEVIDLLLFGDLTPGDYTLAVSPVVVSGDPAPYGLLSPYDVSFVLSVVAQDPISLGGVNNPGTAGNSSIAAAIAGGSVNCEDSVTRLFNPAFRGKPNWSAVIAGIAKGDCLVREQAAASFAQLTVSTASGNYLIQRAADRGVQKPLRTGMSDPLFRRLVVSITNNKLTQAAFYEVLDVFYGREAVSAYVETSVEEPYPLFDDATLNILIDEKFRVEVVLRRAEYHIFRRARAAELAAAITRAIEVTGCTGYAVAVRNSLSGLQRVRIYSGTKGLGSSVRVTSGTSQNVLGFPQNLFPEPAISPGLPGWEIEPRPNGKARYYASLDSLYNFANADVGDYISVIGVEFAEGNRGSFVIEEVSYSYVAGVLVQWVEVTNTTATAQITPQAEYFSVQVFRPRKATLYDSPSYALVSQHGGTARVSIAATTSAVSREKTEAAYCQVADSIDFTTLLRDVNGAVNVTTATAHGISVGQRFIIDDFIPEFLSPASSGGSASTAFSSFDEESGTSPLTARTTWNQDTTFEGADFKTINDLDGDLWFIGGNTYSSLGVPTAINKAGILKAVAVAADSTGQRSYTYRYSRGSIDASLNLGTAPVLLDSATYYNQLRLIGGYNNTPWGGPTASAELQAIVGATTKTAVKETVLAVSQFSNAEGLLAAVALYMTANPINGDILTVTDGTTTRNYGFGVGGDVTVVIGGTSAITMANLATAIAGDGGAAWSAEYAATMTSPFISATAVVITEDQVLTTKSALRIYGNAGAAAKINVVSYADASQALPDYTAGVVAALPTANPGFGTAGFHRDLPELAADEIHAVLNGAVYRRWNAAGTAWSSTIIWNSTALSGGTLATPIAEAAATWLSGPNVMLVTGGITTLNKATAGVQEGLTGWAGMPASMKFPRCSHSSVKLDATHVLVIGGRAPANDAKRATNGYTSWNFDDAFAATDFTGPVAVAISGNVRTAGKIGHGVSLATATSSATAGAPQTAFNTALTGNYTISGWMTAGNGCVFRNGIAGAWASAADNTLLAFGVDPADDKFFLTWMNGGGGVVTTKKTTATRAALMGTHYTVPYPRYHYFAITKVNSGPNAIFTLYINGRSAGTWTDLSPSAGANGLFSFSQASGAVARFLGCVDAVGFTATVLTDAQVWEQYVDEVGVLYENPNDALASPVGRVLSSCEIVPQNISVGNPSVITGPMSYARFAHSTVQLTDGRIVVIGGVGYNPTSPDNSYSKSQRELELKSAEIYDPSLRSWTPLADMLEPHSYAAVAYIARENRIYVSGGFTSRKTEYLDLTTMKWHVSAAGFPQLGVKSHGGGGLVGTDVLALVGGAQYNILTTPYYDTATVGPLDYTMTPAAEVIVAGGINGEHVAIAGTSGSTLKFQTPEHAFYTSAVAATGKVTPVAAPADTGIPGPFIFDASSGFGVSAAAGTLQTRLEQGRQYSSLTLGSGEADEFPDTTGYLVFRWGYNNSVGPVKYLGRLSNAVLSLDAGFRFPTTIEAGQEVRLLFTRTPYVPDNVESIGAFYLTASNAGRSGAVATLEAISASGIELEVSVRYPGDRGLGNEGRAVSSNYKLSDITAVFGSDDLDREIEDLRNK